MYVCVCITSNKLQFSGHPKRLRPERSPERSPTSQGKATPHIAVDAARFLLASEAMRKGYEKVVPGCRYF